MKIAISGKGGVGKTTLSACLAKYFSKKGNKVIAVDADPDANLGTALGLDYEKAESILPLTEMKELVEERTGAKPGGYGAYLAGTIKAGGSGCYCPENVMLKSLFRHLVLNQDEIVILDMEAGIEHLGRGTTENMDMLIIVIEPGLRSIHTARAVKKMSEDLGIKKLFVVVNKIRSEEEEKLVREKLDDFEVLGIMPYSDSIRESDLKDFSPCDSDKEFTGSIEKIAARLQEYMVEDK